jgi:hypothetical protein
MAEKTHNEFEYRFNPNKINISVKQLSLDSLIRRLHAKELDLFPSYQRKSNLWNKVQQSRLIESLLIRIPLPAFYFDSRDFEKWQVIDGLQRVSTFYNYIVQQNFALEGLEFLPEYNGYFFYNLPRELQHRIEEFTLTVYLVEQGTPEEIKYIIFDRINTAGVTLNQQELRFALNQGIATEFLTELSRTDEFVRLTRSAVSPTRMMDLELVNRFLAFYLFFDRYNGNLGTFLNQCLYALNRENLGINFDKIRSDFRKSMASADSIFNGAAFRKYQARDGRHSKFNKALFEALSVNLAWLSDVELQRLLRERGEFIDSFNQLFDDPNFSDSLVKTPNTKRNVSIRFNHLKDSIRKFAAK